VSEPGQEGSAPAPAEEPAQAGHAPAEAQGAAAAQVKPSAKAEDDDAGRSEPPPKPEEQDPDRDQRDGLAVRQERASGLRMFFLGPTSFGGHAAGRDVSVGSLGSMATVRAVVGRVHSQLVADLAEVFVAPVSYDATARILDKRRIVVVGGPAGTGKYATALHLLYGLGVQEICNWESSTVVAQLTTGDVQPSLGYIIRSLAPEQASQLSAVRLDHVAQMLEGRRSYVVITVDDLASLRDDVREEFLVLHTPPEAAAVVRQHLRRLAAGAPPDDVDAVLREPAIANELRAARQPRQARDLAEMVADSIAGRTTRQQTVDRLQVRATNEAVRLLEEAGTLRDGHETRLQGRRRRAFLIALAAFGSMPYATVARAAGALEPLLHQVEDPYAPLAREIFPYPREHWLTVASTTQSADLERTWLGARSVTRVSLANPALAPAILTVMWQDHVAAREPILEWLKTFIAEQNPALRVRAAQVVGLLAALDFDHAYSAAITRWAASTSSWQRAAAAWALEAAAGREESAVTEHVRQLLRIWCRSGSPQRRLTAIAAYGTRIGAMFPGEALAGLRSIIETGGDGLTLPVARSLAEMLVVGRDPGTFSLLAEWAGSRRARLRRQAAHCAAEAATLLDTPSRVPAVLARYAEDDTERTAVRAIFVAGLQDEDTRAALWSELRAWASAADNEPAVAEQLRVLLTDLGSHPDIDAGLHRRVRFQLRLWSGPPHPSATAAAVLADLRRG
jgi:PHD/YefM family antitoxin component YafN of YafNO toxin-antitoxin module